MRNITKKLFGPAIALTVFTTSCSPDDGSTPGCITSKQIADDESRSPKSSSGDSKKYNSNERTTLSKQADCSNKKENKAGSSSAIPAATTAPAMASPMNPSPKPSQSTIASPGPHSPYPKDLAQNPEYPQREPAADKSFVTNSLSAQTAALHEAPLLSKSLSFAPQHIIEVKACDLTEDVDIFGTDSGFVLIGRMDCSDRHHVYALTTDYSGKILEGPTLLSQECSVSAGVTNVKSTQLKDEIITGFTCTPPGQAKRIFTKIVTKADLNVRSVPYDFNAASTELKWMTPSDSDFAYSFDERKIYRLDYATDSISAIYSTPSSTKISTIFAANKMLFVSLVPSSTSTTLLILEEDGTARCQATLLEKTVLLGIFSDGIAAAAKSFDSLTSTSIARQSIDFTTCGSGYTGSSLFPANATNSSINTSSNTNSYWAGFLWNGTNQLLVPATRQTSMTISTFSAAGKWHIAGTTTIELPYSTWKHQFIKIGERAGIVSVYSNRIEVRRSNERLAEGIVVGMPR